MPNFRAFARLTMLLLLPACGVGCAETNKTAAARPDARAFVEDVGPQNRGDLKDAGQLDLSYARWQEQTGNLPAAGKAYQRVLDANPKSQDALLGLARLEQLAGREATAEMAFRKAVAADTKQPQALDALGQFYASQQRWAEAAQVLDGAVKGEPQDTVYRQHYAVALVRAGRPGEALPHFAKAVGEAEAHYNVGYLLFEQNQLAAAELEFRQAATIAPGLEAAQIMLDEVRRGRDDALLARGVLPTGEIQPVSASAPQQTAHGHSVATSTARQGNNPAAPPAGGSPSVTRGWQPSPQSDLTPTQREQLKNQRAAGY